jgi:hypothetical protein
VGSGLVVGSLGQALVAEDVFPVPVDRVPEDRVPEDRVPEDRVQEDRVPVLVALVCTVPFLH